MRVTVIDYGIGNLYSVQRAFESCGAEVTFASDASGVDAAQRLVLPGVGAFADGMRGLRDRGLIEPLRRVANSGRPMLAICLGMQMLASASEEFGQHEGLGVIPGKVVSIPDKDTTGLAQKIPLIGWNALEAPPRTDWRGTLLQDTSPGTAVYLVHSYHVVTDDAANLLATYEYGGHRITAAILSGKIFGCQFHPEKSGREGLKILESFLRIEAA
jgi:imidazole glycerol-phosphate synthase subunit HisH